MNKNIEVGQAELEDLLVTILRCIGGRLHQPDWLELFPDGVLLEYRERARRAVSCIVAGIRADTLVALREMQSEEANSNARESRKSC